MGTANPHPLLVYKQLTGIPTRGDSDKGGPAQYQSLESHPTTLPALSLGETVPSVPFPDTVLPTYPHHLLPGAPPAGPCTFPLLLEGQVTRAPRPGHEFVCLLQTTPAVFKVFVEMVDSLCCLHVSVSPLLGLHKYF